MDDDSHEDANDPTNKRAFAGRLRAEKGLLNQQSTKTYLGGTKVAGPSSKCSVNLYTNKPHYPGPSEITAAERMGTPTSMTAFLRLQHTGLSQIFSGTLRSSGMDVQKL